LFCVPRGGRGVAVLGVCLALGACASGHGPAPLSLAEPLPAAKDDKQPKLADKSELAKATEWWGGKYAANTRDLEAALNYARNLAHDQPSILSNLALANAMNGEPAKAEVMLRQAAAADPSAPKIRQNLALVLGLQGKNDEAKRLAEMDMPADKAAENADYLRRVVKLDPKQAPGDAEPHVAAAVPAPAPIGKKSANI